MNIQAKARSNLTRTNSSLIGIPEGNEPVASRINSPQFAQESEGQTTGPLPSREPSAGSVHAVHFADNVVSVVSPFQVDRVAAPSGLSLQQRSRLVGKDLMARLYDRPENSQAVVTVRQQEAMRRKEDLGEPTKHAVPRPPSGKSRPPVAAFRTTLLKKDIDRKRQQTKHAPISVNMFQNGKPNGNQVLPSIDANVGSGKEQDNIQDVSSDLALDDTKSDISDTSDLPPLLLDKLADKKVVKFSEPLPNSDDILPKTPPPAHRSPDELPTPVPEMARASPEGTPDMQIPMSPVLNSDCTLSVCRPSSGRGSHHADPSAAVTYLQKNPYDNTVPEIENFMEAVVGLRQNIGWICSIPRHGPGSRRALDKLQDRPDPEKDIEGAVAAKDDSGQFVYALPYNRKNPRSRYNPYDLQVVSANTARAHKAYFTGSASYVSRVVESGGPDDSEQTPTLHWFWERRLFNSVHQLPVFVKFRMWKAFKLWRLNVRHCKNSSNRLVLSKTLFVANEVLQGAMLHVRDMCEAACGSLTGQGEAEAAIKLVKLDKSVTLTLTEFIEVQQQQCKLALSQMNALRDSVVDILWQACATVAEMEGVTHGIRDADQTSAGLDCEGDKQQKKNEETREIKYKIKTKYGEIPVYEKKSKNKKKVDRPTYAQVAEWRKILNRLCYFLRSVDFLILELLRRLVLTATRSLVKFMVSSYNTGMAQDDQELVSEDDSEDETPRQQVQSSLLRSSKSGISSISGSKKNPEVPVMPTYDVPHFDFDEKEEEVEPPNIDEILKEIEEGKNVVVDSSSVLSIQLELRVPSNDPRRHSVSQDSSSLSGTEDSAGRKRLKQHNGKARKNADGRKAVKFSDAASETDIELSSSEEEEDMDSEDEYEDEEEDEEDDYDEDQRPQNRFAYSDNRFEKPQGQSRVCIALFPSELDIENGIRGIVYGFENTVGQVESMLKEPKLAVFYSAPKHDLRLNFDEEKEEEESDERPWPDLEMLFGDDAEYQGLIMELMQYTATTLNLILDYTHSFDKYTQMVDMARLVDVEHSMSKKMWSTDEFQHILAIHTEQICEMKSMRKKRRHGMMDVHSVGFCDSCLPYPQQVVKAVSDNLPVVALKHNEDLLTIIKGACKRLDKFPSSVEEFVDHLSFLGKMASEMPALEREYAVVIKLYTIAKDFEVEVHPEEHALYQTLSPSFQHLKTLILYAEAKKEDNIRKFSTHLDSLIQKIRLQITDIKNRVRDPVLLHGDTMASTALDKINFLTEEVSSLATKARSYANYQERFGNSLTSNKKQFSEDFLMSDRNDENSTREMQTDLSEIERDLTLRQLLWESAEEWDKLSAEWTTTAFDVLQVEALQKNVNRFSQTVYMLEKGLPHNEVVPKLKEKVTDFKLVMPCITSLRNPSLRSRHWEQIEKIIGKSIVRNKEFTLGDLLDMNITKFKERVQDISTTASNEATLERMLQKVVDLWQGTDFRLVAHASGAVMIIAGADDILAMLEESQVTIGTIRGSRYVTPIKGTVEEWERKLALFSRTLDEWMVCQRNWLYLEQIFTTPDIQRQLPSESKLFGGVDKTWKDIMRRTEDRPNALKSATAPGVLEMLQSANSSLEKIHKCLEDYLETKRLVFPRFYFLSNDDLLDILAQSKNPEAVQPHLGKCFGNIRALEIKTLPRQPPTVKTITSAEGEIINMPKNVRARGPVEQWLGSVETGMFDTVKKHLKIGLQDWLGIKHDDWVLKHPGQVVLTVAQIMFNKEVIQALSSSNAVSNLTDLRDKMVEILNGLAALVSSNLMPHKRLSINALLTIDVHNRDIINSMIDNNIDRPDDFEWTRQLRYEWDEQSNNCNVLQSHASFVYGYEYLGCSPRLVITPLTDRCYLTLTGALHLHLGGSPAGPAGTGKTETVKDLAKAMGKQCVVFNCSEGLDFKMLGKFFSGLAQSGSWCCFDEFNRIETEVLSVVAQQIHTIKTAKDQMAPRFVFETRDIRLNMTCGFFITMNPSYAGRVELPDNLKSLFRQVAMMVPDYALIAEIMLFSEGFTAGNSLSTKVVNLYQLASKQLSQQDHYDFGMRAIKSVLVMAGLRKRQMQEMDEGEGKRDISQEEEAYILIHALRDANLPKFLAEDVPLFESIMADLFPGIKPPSPPMEALEKAISMSVRDQGLQHWPSQMEKVKQLYSQILVRHGVMLVGPTGGGKSTIRNILQRALVLLPTISVDDEQMLAQFEGRKGNLGRKQSIFIHNRNKKGHVETFAINPKCIKLGELYGETDPNTFEWTDGLIATATRKFARDQLTGVADDPLRPSTSSTLQSASRLQTPQTTGTSSVAQSEAGESRGESEASGTTSFSQQAIQEGAMDTVPTDWRWLVLDGPVDTLWVENLNTVLDDSKVLCLANGERIALTNGMRLLFEVDDLSQASPATVSRCAMVYLDPVYLGWRPFVKTWIQRLPRDIPETGRKHLQALFDHSIDRGLVFAKTFVKQQVIPAPDMSFISCLCNILSAYFDFMVKHGGFGNQDKEHGRPGSADSEVSSHSRSSSRPSSRTERRKKKTLRKKKEEMKAIPESAIKTSFGSDTEKQYFLQRNPGSLTVLLGKLFVFAYTWSFGGNFKRQDDLDDDAGIGRKGGDRRDFIDIDIASEFDNFVREVFEVEPPIGVRLPASSRNIYSYFVNMDTGNFISWEALVPTTQSLIEKGAVITLGETMGVSSDGSGGQQNKAGMDIVTTVDTVRYSFMAGLFLVNKNPVLLTGESGVGKTAIVKHLLGRLEKEGGTSFKSGTVLGSVLNFSDKNKTLLDNISSLTKMGQDAEESQLEAMMGGLRSRANQQTGLLTCNLQYSAQTTASRTQQALISRLIKKGRDTLGAPRGKKVVVFIDDLNMPAQEVYGAQPPLELLRQFLDLGGFYDTKKLVWKDVLDVTLIAACGPPGGGRNPVSPRLLKHFCMLALPQPSTRSLQHIYQVQLGRFFHEAEFMPEVKECLFPLVSASIAIYYRMCGTMRPTPAKSHYTFNIRDLSQVVNGLLEADGSVIVNSDNCAQLFAHEATRVFHDRLVDDSDRTHFFQALADNLHDHFKVKWTPEQLQSSPILFSDFLDSHDGEANSRVYKSVNDHAKLSAVLEELYMRQHLSNPQAPQLVFFKEAVEHVLRTARVFRSPGGHMLLVGMDGTGKSTTVQLASYVCGCELFKLTLTRGYNLPEFRDDLKKVCIMSGVKGLNTVFLLTDGDIVKESFLEDVNCILNSGEVPDLFDNEEIDGISMELKAAAAVAQIPDTRQAVYNFFIQRVKKNLHIVLAMSPAGTKFRQRCRMNPSLINCCTIDWYNEWDRPAMTSVAQMYLQNAEFVCDEDRNVQELKKDVASCCVDIHTSISEASDQFWQEVKRRYYVTPSSYMELIRLYASMLHNKKQELMTNRQRLLVGLSSLSEATSLVGVMQEELRALGPKIVEKARDTEVLLQQLEKDQDAVDQVREIVEAEEAVMKKETQVVQDYADECQRDLASVIPALQTAIESLDSLDKADIAEIRVYANPPILVIMVLSAVCVLLREKPDWATAKQVLADPVFLKKLVNFDKNNVPEKVFKKLKKYSEHEDFTPDKVGRVSLACKSMCQWVMALQHYHEVYKMAKPKQKRVEEAKEALQLAQKNLAQKQASLSKIQGHLQSLQQQYQDSVTQRESLKERQILTGLRLQRASVLIEAVCDEKVRWSASVETLDFKLKTLVGDTLVSAGAVAYLGAFNHKYRHQLLSMWTNKCTERNIPISEHYDLVNCMADANLVLRWHTEGLPQDIHSTESAIMVKHGRRWPLLIDPQGQASIWIKEMEGMKLKVCKASDSNFMRTMERAIRVGDPVLLQDVGETLDPSLKPILLQETIVRAGHQVIQIGDTEIEYNASFRLYLATSLSNPHFLPGVCIKVTLINFTVTFEGLQEQLLSGVVRQERPQLENERNALLESIASDRLLLRELEDKTLELLHSSQGHLLDDQDLVETLQKSKTMSEEILGRVDQSEDAEKKLNLARHKYLPVATRGSVLYFVLADLSLVDVMYQFSLSWFQNIFISCINLSGSQPPSNTTPRLSGTIRPVSSLRGDLLKPSRMTPSEARPVTPVDLNQHMEDMISRLTSSVYRMVCRALFAQHQLMFSFLLCSSIMKSVASGAQVGYIGRIEDVEWHVFLQGRIMASMMDEASLKKYDGLSPMQRLDMENTGVGPSRLRWITDQMWRRCQHLEAMFDCFEQLCCCIISCPVQWQVFLDSDDSYHLMGNKFDLEKHMEGGKVTAEMIVFPWECLSSFQRLLLLQILKPSMLIAAARTFVAEQMGGEFVAVGHIDLKEVFEEANAKTPLIFLLSPGSDPASMLLRYAKEVRGSTLHLDMISLGRGQGPKAEELISKAQILKGRWLFLQNCHLAASWMPRLQNIVDNFNKPGSDVDPQFRLWLSSKPDPCFPISILQTGIKMTVEPPRGVKANLLRNVTASTGAFERTYEESCANQVAWRNLLVGLCFFNAVIHERKKFGRLGWNIPYEFNDSDLEVSVMELELLLTAQQEIPWPALWYLTGDVTFGGRVTDDWDSRCLKSLLQKFYHPRALQQGYTYSSDKVYRPISPDSNLEEVRAYIEQLPSQDTPELFGMNSNAQQASLEYQAKELVDLILSVQPRLTTSIIGSGKSSDDLVLEIAEDIVRMMPQVIEVIEGDSRQGQQPRLNLTEMIKISNSDTLPAKYTPRSKKHDGDGGGITKKEKAAVPNDEPEQSALQEVKQLCMSALFTVLRQEIDRFNNLLTIIHTSLNTLMLAVKGEVVMSETLEEAYSALLMQKVPAQWKAASYESCKSLGGWVKDLIQRVDFFGEWLEKVIMAGEKVLKPPSYVAPTDKTNSQQTEDGAEENWRLTQPRSFWLPAFFFPQGFLTAVLQNHARQVGVSVDSLSFAFKVNESREDTDDTLNDVKQKLSVKEAGFKGPSPPADGVLVFGLYLDGARWDLTNHTLSDSLPGQRFCRLPEIHFMPSLDPSLRPTSANLESPAAMFKSQQETADGSVKATYDCPLYRTSARAGTLSSTGHSTNFVASVKLPTEHVAQFWVMRGVALLCQLDE